MGARSSFIFSALLRARIALLDLFGCLDHGVSRLRIPVSPSLFFRRQDR
jgi:hypothetical protein